MTSLRSWTLFAGLALFAVACKTEGASPTTAEPPQTGTPVPSGPTVTLDSSTVFQTMGGWQVPVLQTVRDYYAVRPSLDRLFDAGVNDLGLNRISIEVFPGVENSTADCQQAYLDNQTTEDQYLRDCAYNPVNDNNDPAVANPRGFHFLILDWQIDNLLLPMKRQLEARGESLYVNVRLIDYRLSTFEQNQNPAEYAELVLAIFDHIRGKYGFAPDSFDLINEPDGANGWRDPALIGRLAAATGQRLASAGYRPEFTGPSTVNKGNAVSYFDAMLAQPGASQYLKELSWHCYDDTGQNSSSQIAARGLSANVRTVQSECWTGSNTYQLLHQELKTSRNAVWGMGPIHGNNGYYQVNGDGSFTLRDRAKYMRQYYKYIRFGARRIGATSSTDSVDPVAFINTDGRYVVVLKTQAAATVTITNLPAGTYGIYSTTGPDPSSVSAFDVTAPDQTVGANGRLTASIQGGGVLTVYRKGSGAGGSLAERQGGGEAPQGPATDSPLLGGTTTERDAHLHLTRDGVALELSWLSDGTHQPVDVATPDLRVFVAEKTRITVVSDGSILALPALTLATDAREGAEELHAIAADANFGANHFLYTLSSLDNGARTFRVSRYVETGNRLFNRIVLLDGVPASAAPGGSLRIGPDGALYVAFDEGTGADAVGDAASYNGKVLRLNPDGTTPRDSRLGSTVFAAGYRFPRGLGWERSAQTMWIAGQDGRGFVDVLGPGDAGPGTRLGRYLLPSDLSASALAVYRGNRAPLMVDNVLVASADAGGLLRLMPDPANRLAPPIGERLLSGDTGSIRALAVSVDGLIYLGSDRGLGLLVPGSAQQSLLP